MKSEKSRIGYALALSKYIKGFKIYLIIATLCNMIFKVLPIVIAFITSYMVSAAILGDVSQIKMLLIIVGILVAADAFFSYFDMLVSHDMTYKILTKLRDKAYDKIDEISPAAMEERQSGDLISIVLDDIEQLEWFYAHSIPQIIVAVVVPLCALIFMGKFSWVLPTVILPFIIILVFLPKITARKDDSQGSEVKKITGIIHSEIIDCVQGLKDIISFQWQEEYFKKFHKTNDDYNIASMTYAQRSSNEKRIINIIIDIGVLTTEMTAVLLVLNNYLEIVWMIPMFLLSSAIFSPVKEVLTMSTNYGLIFGSAERLLNLFQLSPSVQDIEMNTLLKSYDNDNDEKITIEFENVTFAYPSTVLNIKNKNILENLSFDVKNGESIALVGASGSGKTTIARLLQRFWDVNSGNIKINGVDIRKTSLESLRNVITVVPQEVYLFNISIEENLKIAKENATHEDVIFAAKEAQADTFIQKFPDSYDTVVGERGLRLSGGEKQRISIAQAFLKNSPVLILDEASANLDSENERLINLAINKLKKGRATIIIAHRISTIKSADRIIAIKNGSVIGEGTYQHLIKTCSYFKALIGDENEDK